MCAYRKTRLPAVLSVRSIVTVFHTELQNRYSSGEAHDFPELLYVDKGPHTVLVDDIVYHLDAGQIIIYAPHSFHKTALLSTATVDIISFESDSALLSCFFNRVITLNSRQRALLSQIITAGVDIFEHAREADGLIGMTPRAGTNDYELQQLKNRLELLLIDILRADEPKETGPTAANHDNYQKEQFDALTAYLKAHLSEPLTLEQISEGCVMSVSKLKRLCREQCGCAPIAYLISLRIAEAKRMIRETSLNFTQIAEALGFGSVHYFSKLFKEKVGMTPSEYAKTMCKK